MPGKVAREGGILGIIIFGEGGAEMLAMCSVGVDMPVPKSTERERLVASGEDEAEDAGVFVGSGQVEEQTLSCFGASARRSAGFVA